MSKFTKKKSGEVPPVSTASFPDIIFMLLFFFITVTETKNIDGGKEFAVHVNKDLTNMNSVQFNNGVAINNNGINAGNKTITNVTAGQNDTDAVNVSQLNNAKDKEEIKFDVRARAKDAQGGDVYYNNTPLVAIKSFSLKVHSNAVLVISLVNLLGNEDAVGYLFLGATEVSKASFKVFSSNEDTKKTEWSYDLSAGSSSEEWEQLQTNMMGYIMPNGKVNEQEWRDRNALFKVIGENNLEVGEK